MENEIDYNYLAQNGIMHLEDLVGKTLYFVFASQGIQPRKVRKIQFTEKTKEWFFEACATLRISEIGKTIFFSEDEAIEYQHSIMDRYTKEQQEKIAFREEMQKKQDLNQLERLIKKYAGFADECLKGLKAEEANERVKKSKKTDDSSKLDTWDIYGDM